MPKNIYGNTKRGWGIIMDLSDALKYFKNYNITFKQNDWGLHEVRKGNIIIQNIVLNEAVSSKTSKQEV